MPEAKLNVDRLILKVSDLPALPQTASEVMRVANDPSASAQELEQVVERDQALTGRVLRLVNSAAFGLRSKVGSARDAVVLLGLRRVKQIATALSMSGLFQDAAGGRVVGEALWAHALATGLWVKNLATLGVWSLDDSMFATALLHDMGILILAQHEEKRYTRILEFAAKKCKPVHRIERTVFGMTHAQVGAMLCSRWELPGSIVARIKNHHALPSDMDQDDKILRAAELLAGQTGFPEFPWQTPANPEAFLKNELELSDQQIERLLSKSTNVLEELSAYMTG